MHPQRHTELRVKEFYGAMGVDLWKLAEWQEALADVEVAVLTPQVCSLEESSWANRLEVFSSLANRLVVFRCSTAFGCLLNVIMEPRIRGGC
jgi:hypothetical protein